MAIFPILSREMPSDSRVGETYTVTRYSDGSWTCKCTAFAINRNRGALSYQCKHIQRAQLTIAESIANQPLTYRLDILAEQARPTIEADRAYKREMQRRRAERTKAMKERLASEPGTGPGDPISERENAPVAMTPEPAAAPSPPTRPRIDSLVREARDMDLAL